MKRLGRTLFTGFLIVALAGCSAIGISAGKSAKSYASSLKKEVSSLSSYEVGGMLLGSSHDYYESWKESYDGVDEAYLVDNGFTSQEIKIELNVIKIITYLADNLPVPTGDDDSKVGNINAAYLGDADSDSLVTGIYIYQFNKDTGITTNEYTSANLATENYDNDYYPEYFFAKGKTIVCIDAVWLSDNGTSLSTVLAALDKIIK